MSEPFHLLDLVSQAAPVQRHLRGRSHEEKLAWLAAHGRVTERPQTYAAAQRIYEFESGLGRTCFFFLDKDDIVFIGEQTTFTVGAEE
jgi:hypothetical protein